MDINSMYNTAKSMIDRVKAARPDAISDDAALCLIFTEDRKIFTGISSIRVTENEVLTVSAENNAIMSMISEQKLEASDMITVSFSDYSICIPDEDSLELLFRASDSNYNCNIVVSHDKMIPAQEMENFDAQDVQPPETDTPSPFADNFDSSDFNSGFDFDSVTPDQPVQTLGSPAEFVSNITQDTNNPFYEAPSDAPAADAPVSLNNMPEYNNNPQQQSGYMYQQPAANSVQFGNQYQANPYQQPMQNGYPQQGMQQPMNGQYVQQPMNPYGQPINPYNQQGMPVQQGGYMNGYYQPQYPQQPMSGGYYNGIVSGQYPQSNNQYQQSTQYQRNSVMVSGTMNTSGKSSAFRKRLNSYMNDGSGDNNNSLKTPETVSSNSSNLNQAQASANKIAHDMQNGKAPSIDEMMRDAKKQKKVAKVNSDFKKKMKDMGL